MQDCFICEAPAPISLFKLLPTSNFLPLKGFSYFFLAVVHITTSVYYLILSRLSLSALSLDIQCLCLPTQMTLSLINNFSIFFLFTILPLLIEKIISI